MYVRIVLSTRRKYHTKFDFWHNERGYFIRLFGVVTANLKLVR